MARLNDEKAKQAAEASSSFEAVPDGVYHARLRDVDTSREGPSGPYWSWEYEIVEPGDHTDRRLWNNTSLAANALWKLKETYDAFGVPTDADTDDLCGRVVKLVVSTRTIQGGARAGDIGNQVDRVLPPDDDFEVEAAPGASQKADDIF